MAVGRCEGKAFAGIVNLRRVSRGLLVPVCESVACGVDPLAVEAD